MGKKGRAPKVIQIFFKIPKRDQKSFGEHSFSFVAPSVRNSLPAILRNVPTLSHVIFHLKAFLFAHAFRQNLALFLIKDGVSVGSLSEEGSKWRERRERQTKCMERA